MGTTQQLSLLDAVEAGQATGPLARVDRYVPVYRVRLVRESGVRAEMEQISDPWAAATIFNQLLEDADREYVLVMMLDAKNKVIGINVASMGTLDSAHVNMREIFKPALLANAAAIIVGHNHPSGDPSPSPEDIVVTRELVQAGKILGVQVLDHLIIGYRRHASLKERGLGFS